MNSEMRSHIKKYKFAIVHSLTNYYYCAAAMESVVGCGYEYAATVTKAFPCGGGRDVEANASFLV
jgi:hypothetical protein